MGSFGFHCAVCEQPMLSDGPDYGEHCFKCEEEFSEKGGCKSTNYLLSPNGEVYEEKNYEGYGVYGGKDAYALLAQTNIDTIREWFNLPDWEPSGDNDEDRGIGIDLMFNKREKTHEEIKVMIDKGITITKDNIYHYAKDLIKNPLRIVCEDCKDVKYNQINYCQYSRDHSNQSWTTASETDVGWVCEECYLW